MNSISIDIGTSNIKIIETDEKLTHNQRIFVKLTEPYVDGAKAEIV